MPSCAQLSNSRLAGRSEAGSRPGRAARRCSWTAHVARRLAVAALAALAVAVPASGGGGTHFGLQGSQADGRLVRVNPTTLRTLDPSLRVGNFTAERAISPDGRTIALVSQDRPIVRLVDLGRMRVLGGAELAAEGDVHVLRWT